ncbi:hypothetical protein [Synechococcus sp. CS-1328]|uniref:hypothetical protein n=1 Tax=Synechococcus sp. CS-1328 TaxID=2847976 RepID=UPI00223B3C18|nr:hypothetical protein [Synechococcus sp. CS-1328]MCT0225746.1 hypothetical protein [Synechococcus sp. CS-1328]
METNPAEGRGGKDTPAAQGRELILWLLERQWNPQRLRTGLSSQDDLQQLCLEEVIGLREQGQAQLSLGLIERALTSGLASPWLEDNRARALLVLGDEEAALAIWQALQAHPETSVAGTAEAMASSLGSEPSAIENAATETGDTETGDAANKDAELTTVAAQLCGVLEAAERSSDRLQGATQGWEELENTCLEEAIQLREDGNATLSLALITAAQEQGLRSPWLDDNRARALVGLERKEEAFQIWQELSQHPDAACAGMAADMVELMRNGLLEPLKQVCLQRGWPPRHLEGEPSETGSPLEWALREVITSREGQQPELSLALVERCLQLGWSSPWLRDNQARALVHLERMEEAVPLWRELAATADDSMLMAMADEMVQLYGPPAERARRCRQAEALLADNNNAAAESLLIEGLLIDPGSEEYRQLLQRVIEQQGGETESNLLGSELREPTLRLEVHRRLLEALEQELQPAAISPPA